MPEDTLRINFNTYDTLNIKDTFQNKQIVLIESQKHESKFLGVETDFWGMFLIPVISFLLALLVNRIIQKIKLKNDLLQKQTFLFTWVDLINEQIAKQVKTYRDFAAELKNVDNIPLEINNYNLHIDKLKQIDSPTLISIFSTNKKGNAELNNKLLFEFENNIAFLSSKRETTKEVLNVFIEQSVKNSSDWEENILGTHSIVRTILQNPELLSNAFYNEVLRLYREWTTSKTPIVSKIASKEMFIEKAESLCQPYLALNSSDNLAFDLLERSQILLLTFKRIEAINELTAKRLIEAASKVDDGYKKLKQVKSELSKLDFKFFFFLK